MPICTAPTHPTTACPELEGECGGWLHPNADEPEPSWCTALAPLTFQGPTTWPPPTSMQRYAEDRRLGQRVPPSVSTWRPQDVRRQQEADARIRGLAPERPAVVVAWEPGPSCEGKAVR